MRDAIEHFISVPLILRSIYWHLVLSLVEEVEDSIVTSHDGMVFCNCFSFTFHFFRNQSEHRACYEWGRRWVPYYIMLKLFFYCARIKACGTINVKPMPNNKSVLFLLPQRNFSRNKNLWWNTIMMIHWRERASDSIPFLLHSAHTAERHWRYINVSTARSTDCSRYQQIHEQKQRTASEQIHTHHPSDREETKMTARRTILW